MPTTIKPRRLAAATAAGTALAAVLSMGAVAPAVAAEGTQTQTMTNAAISTQGAAGLTKHKTQVLEFHRLLNNFRKAHGRSPVKFNAEVSADMYQFSVKQFQSGNLSAPHEYSLPDLDYWSSMSAQCGGNKASDLFEMLDYPHLRPLLLDKNMEAYGVGMHFAKDGRMYGSLLLYTVDPNSGRPNLPNTWENPADYFNAKPALKSAAGVFRDVHVGDAFYTPIKWLRDEGITYGYSDGHFGVRKPITRGEAASFLYRIAGWPEVTSTPRFKDVASSSHAEGIAWMAENGYSQGYSDSTFRPNQPVTRGELASFVFRASQDKDRQWAEDMEEEWSEYVAPAKSAFGDVPESSSHYPAISWLRTDGGITGYSDGTFRPGQNITRGESAKMLYTLRD